MSDPEEDRTDGARGLPALRTVADYQFGAGAGRALFPPDEDAEVRRSSSGRPRQVVLDGATPPVRVVSYGVDGRFTLGLEGGRRLAAVFDPPRLRVRVGDESVPYVSEGKNAFAKFVRDVDDGVRPRDEVLVVHDGAVIAVGRAELSAEGMRDFGTGVAVKVREGRGG